MWRAIIPSKRKVELGGNGGCGGMVSMIALTVLILGVYYVS